MGLLSLRDRQSPIPGSVNPLQNRKTGKTPSLVTEDVAREPLENVAHHKVLEVVSTWSSDRRLEWEERSAIREYDGEIPRQEAEGLAYHDLVGRIEVGQKWGGV
jgi:hypothetical protein